MRKMPYVDPALVEYLDRRFPAALPKDDADIGTIRRLQGRRDVIDFLKDAEKLQSKREE